jgi:rare lipoprotein A
LTAAHPTLPLPSYVRVTNLQNDRSVIVRVNDRGPYRHKRLIDVSQRTAELLGFEHAGRADVRVEYIDRARLDGNDEEFLLASYQGPGADDWHFIGPIVASAEPRMPRPRLTAPSPVQVGDAIGETRSVAYASREARDSGAFQAVTARYDADNRILMAFETATLAE